VRRACIDIGSNTTRLLVADCDGQGLAEVHQERAFNQIGRALREDGTIPPGKVAEVARTVASQLASAAAHGATTVRCIATASVRRAVNGSELVSLIASECGLRVEVLSGEQEARLAFIGAAAMLDEPGLGGPLGVADVGGGSCELIVGATPATISWWASLELGSGTLTEHTIASDPPSAGELEAVRDAVDAALAGISPPPVALAVAVGGSATSLRRLAGGVIDAPALERSLAALCGAPAAELAGRLALDVQRVRLLPAAIVLLGAISRAFAAPLEVGRGGIREGALLEGP
jgi:exopolyphosphatase / guanosine-5'-triphosphate,3'-diphosphate pyrophosphatase